MTRIIDWTGIFEDIGVQFCPGGSRNVRNDNIGIQCPYCGDTESKNHLNCAVNGYYSCWRDGCVAHHTNKTFTSRNPYSLLHTLTKFHNLPRFDVERVVASNSRGDYAPTLRTTPAERACEIPAGAYPLTIDESGRTNPAHRKYTEYLSKRGFTDVAGLGHLLQNYNLHSLNNRILIPYYGPGNELLTYTSRDIADNAKIRYLNCPTEQSVTPAPKTLFGIHLCNNGRRRVPVLCEGPFDVMKMEYLTHSYFGTENPFLFLATSTCHLSLEQSLMLRRVFKGAERCWIFYDKGASTLSLQRHLESIRFPTTIVKLHEINDPGEMTRTTLLEFLNYKGE